MIQAAPRFRDGIVRVQTVLSSAAALEEAGGRLWLESQAGTKAKQPAQTPSNPRAASTPNSTQLNPTEWGTECVLGG